MPLYFFENKRKRKILQNNGKIHAIGRTRVESRACSISDTPPANVPPFAPKYAGIASTRNGEIIMSPIIRGNIQKRICFFVIFSLFGIIIIVNIVRRVIVTNITDVKE